ncbi:hypothetical protein [Celeribacter baekdonensis]|uniref:Uncharacterized protein n=1 Tax=Celeribacter baekdonensis B30 TaxID=1208323 RepID=K2JB05_9RHOB|nr:hypothetical protein [Celeribacter baekdonensis]EKE72002.1 hypothetical protein B30_09538 [Celeribacter baekdonensis B30]
MQHAQHAQFASRISRIERGGPNTFSTVYTGLQDADTPRGKKVSGVTHLTPQHPDRPSARVLMRAGLKSGLMQTTALGLFLLLYLRYVGL